MKKLNEENLYLNFENSNSNMIIVTGISGSGKSTLCEELKKIYNYEIISFDMIFGYEENRGRNKLEKEILSKFLKKYPEYKNLNSNQNKPNVCDDFYDFVNKYITEKNKKIIFDGSYFLKKVPFDKIKEQRIVFKKTSLIKSIIRRTKRNQQYILKKRYPKVRIIKEFYWLYRYNIKHILKWKSEKKYFLNQLKKRGII